MDEILNQLSSFRIVPVVVLDDLENAIPLANSLCQGGLPCAEITFRTEAAEESIKIITNRFPNMLLGAGTILSTEQVDKAINAGAKFIVTPGFNHNVVQYCKENNIPIIPGAVTPFEIEQALNMGLNTIKFFPAEHFGGIDMIEALSSPYYNIKFMPTGGINPKNVIPYLKNDKVVACGGSWMVSKDLLKSKNFDKITALTKEAVSIVQNVREAV